jgi:hypothetical protein
MLRMSLRRGEFVVGGDMRAYNHDKEILSKVWQHRILRRLM